MRNEITRKPGTSTKRFPLQSFIAMLPWHCTFDSKCGLISRKKWPRLSTIEAFCLLIPNSGEGDKLFLGGCQPVNEGQVGGPRRPPFRNFLSHGAFMVVPPVRSPSKAGM